MMMLVSPPKPTVQHNNTFGLQFFHPSLVFPLDLCVMHLYPRCDPVNTSTVTTAAYDSDDKWVETDYRIVSSVTWRLLFYRGHRIQVLRACPLRSLPQIFFLVLCCPPQVVFLSFSCPPPIKMQANFPAH